MTQHDLTAVPPVKWLLVSRWPQLLLRLLALAGFVFAILVGLVGTPVGNRNFSIILVWVGWWAALILVAVPFLGRGWCNICPIPLAGEWLQQGTLLGPSRRQKGVGLGRRWPKALRHIWLQNGAFALLALFSAVILTQPKVTAGVLAAFFFIATGTSLIFERRAFCRYLCPVGGFIGLYSQVAPLEVRIKDRAVCAGHTTKTCYTGSADGYGCPWGAFPGGLVKNTYCGTCMECLRTCPYDNIGVNLRPFGADLSQPRGRRLDEAAKAFVMLGSAAVYSAVMLGPWGSLKTAAYQVGSVAWWGYALGFLAFIFGLLPGLFYLATQAGRALAPTTQSPRQTFTAFAYALIPLGLAAWIAFTLSFMFANGSYLWPLLSDPLAQGWDLLGTADVSWTPYFTATVPSLQTLVLVAGLVWSSVTARGIAAEAAPGTANRRALPVVLFCFLITVGMLWLLVA